VTSTKVSPENTEMRVPHLSGDSEVVVVVEPDSAAVLYIRDAMIDIIINEGIMNICVAGMHQCLEIR